MKLNPFYQIIGHFLIDLAHLVPEMIPIKDLAAHFQLSTQTNMLTCRFNLHQSALGGGHKVTLMLQFKLSLSFTEKPPIFSYFLQPCET